MCVTKGGISADTRKKKICADFLTSGEAKVLRPYCIKDVCLDPTALLSSSKRVTFHFQQEAN